ncbi:MAG TPA: hypothetical protein VNE63_08895 [Candidatus Acidoferrales bacterium]|nr:hypothetical protein [Candidatus Acidoferrales bacterium]
MAEKETSVCGTYRNQAALEYAMYHLRNVGFLDANFTVVFPEGPFNDFRGSGSPGITSRRIAETAEEGGFSDENLDLLDRAIQNGRILLSVQCEGTGQALIATKILDGTEADGVSSSTKSQPPSPSIYRSISFKNVA